MCRVMEDYQRAAVEEATRRGETNKAQDVARQLLQNGMVLDTIAQIVKYPKETVAEWLKS